MVNRLRQPYSNQSGSLDTAGGVVFTALLDGSIHAYNDETLQELWTFETGIAGEPGRAWVIDSDTSEVLALGPTRAFPFAYGFGTFWFANARTIVRSPQP